jgi:hypothetical protein
LRDGQAFDAALFNHLEEGIDVFLAQIIFRNINGPELFAPSKQALYEGFNTRQFRISDTFTHLKLLKSTHVAKSATYSIFHCILVNWRI